jgi:hypothetical protein
LGLGVWDLASGPSRPEKKPTPDKLKLAFKT